MWVCCRMLVCLVTNDNAVINQSSSLTHVSSVPLPNCLDLLWRGCIICVCVCVLWLSGMCLCKSAALLDFTFIYDLLVLSVTFGHSYVCLG